MIRNRRMLRLLSHRGHSQLRSSVKITLHGTQFQSQNSVGLCLALDVALRLRHVAHYRIIGVLAETRRLRQSLVYSTVRFSSVSLIISVISKYRTIAMQ